MAVKLPLAQIAAVPAFGFHNPVRGIPGLTLMAPWAFVGFEVISLETSHFRFSVKSSGAVIAVTANAFREDVEAASAAGMQAHIAKPLDVDRMQETIRSVLEDPSRNS